METNTVNIDTVLYINLLRFSTHDWSRKKAVLQFIF